ncbi:MAG: phytoene/squalene synthase family protein [Xanthobacteraceae bacterium]
MQDAFAHCEGLVRVADKDRFLTTLFAPAEHRPALLALYAFNLEIARIRETAHEALAGEIRLQWWSDVLGGAGRGEVAAHPVAAALLETMARYQLPPERLTALIEARRFDLYDEPMQTLADLEAYGKGASAGLIALAARVLAGDTETEALTHHAGLAHAFVGLLAAFPIHAGRGQVFVPLEILARHGATCQQVLGGQATPQLHEALAELRLHARRHLRAAQQRLAAAPPAVMPALLPVALAGPTLARMERRGYDPFTPLEIAAWRRQLILWRAARWPRWMFD